jgi:hypothetical protein
VVDKHPGLGPELQQLAQTILVMLDPLVQAAAAVASPAENEGGKCQQVWCPVCAVAALASGEPHPLGAVIAAHSVSLLAMVRTLLNPDGPVPDQAPHAATAYEPIPVTIH